MRRNIRLDYGTDTQEFEHYVGRRPKKGELDDWVHYLKKGVEAQLVTGQVKMAHSGSG